MRSDARTWVLVGAGLVLAAALLWFVPRALRAPSASERAGATPASLRAPDEERAGELVGADLGGELAEGGAEARAPVAAEPADEPEDASAAADLARTTFRFRGADGALAGSVAVAVLRGGERVAGGAFPVEGGVASVAVERPAGEARDGAPALVLALAPDHRPYRGEHALAGGAVEIELARGRGLAGRLLVDGVEPAEPVELVVRSESALPIGFALPEAAGEPLAQALEARVARTLATGAGGAFALRGLDDAWRGEIELPSALRFASAPEGAAQVGADRLRFAAPLEGLVLDATARTRIVGRVVAHPGGPPVAGARIQIEPRPADSGPPRPSGPRGVCDDAGRFAVAIDPAFQGALLASGAGWASVRLDLPALPAQGDLDLGDVALETAAPRALALRVVDPDGAPVAGAHAVGEPGRMPLGAPTGAEGTTALGLPARIETLCVVALGYRLHEEPAPAADTAELVVRLARGTALEVECVGPDGAPIRPAGLTVQSVPPLFRGGARMPPDAFRAIGGPHFHVPAPGGGRHLLFTEESALVLCDLEPGVGFELAANDALQRSLAAADVAPLEEGEVRRVRLVARAAGALTGRVTNELGQGVAGATVVVQAPRGEDVTFSTERTTAGDGSFLVAPLLLGPLDVAVEKAGLAPLELARHELAAGRLHLDLALEHGRALVVRLEDEGGAPVEAKVRARVGRRGARASSSEPGRYVLADLPSRPVVLAIERDGATIEREVDPTAGEVRLVLPR